MERLQIIEALKDLPDTLEAEVAGLSDAALRFKPSEDQWSLMEVMGHLRFADEVWYKRLYQVWSLTDPMLVSFDGEAQALEEARNTTDVASSVAAIKASRPRIVDLLVHAVDWTRVGQWRGVGRRSFTQLAEALVEHDREHVEQIRALKAAQAAPARA